LVSQGELSIMWANPLVGSITTLAFVLLLWPIISKLLAIVMPKRASNLPAKQPVD